MSDKNKNDLVILMADDDEEDRMLAQEAWEESHLANPLIFIEDGEELMDYLKGKGAYKNKKVQKPGIILLDLNMPRKDGREALEEIKNDPELKKIPVVVLTTSQADEDILRTYDLGVSSFIIKPVTFQRLTEVMRTIGNYWIKVVELPPTEGQTN